MSVMQQVGKIESQGFPESYLLIKAADTNVTIRTVCSFGWLVIFTEFTPPVVLGR